MRDHPNHQQAPFAPNRSQQARARIQQRLRQIQYSPVCSCHPNGGHSSEEPPQRDTVKIRR